MMLRILLAISAMTCLMSGMAYAQADTLGIDKSEMNQQQRIERGIASGQLTEKEAARMNK